ncbi:MAG: hypothetical protein L0Y44_16650 [Phycisphaerales bacterium]|nr:hypothetical protein [Phycisphaerales bacterium]
MTVLLSNRCKPGEVRDAILAVLRERREATVAEVRRVVAERLNVTCSPSSVRSYLRLNTPQLFDRTARGTYRLKQSTIKAEPAAAGEVATPSFLFGRSRLFKGDCLTWLEQQPPRSLHAIVTDPPYGLVEYTASQQAKLRAGRGGVWRIPPSFDGHQRSPLPRFTVLDKRDLGALRDFFNRWGRACWPVLVPGAHVVVASNPLVSYWVAMALAEVGFERRGEVIRLVMTMRGGDRPKNAHVEFSEVSVMPRSTFEPWLLFRKPLEGRVQDNLRKWKTGGLRRPSLEQPFFDVIPSGPTRPAERRLAPHPSLKPQAFLRKVVRAVLPLGQGTVLDPFAGSGSTIAAAEAVGYQSVGIELDPHFIDMARSAIPKLHRYQPPPERNR